VQVSNFLVDAHEDYNCFGEVCVKLKKTATETFEVLKSAYCEELFIENECVSMVRKAQRRARIVTRG
jgi:hypothetical protein